MRVKVFKFDRADNFQYTLTFKGVNEIVMKGTEPMFGVEGSPRKSVMHIPEDVSKGIRKGSNTARATIGCTTIKYYKGFIYRRTYDYRRDSIFIAQYSKIIGAIREKVKHTEYNVSVLDPIINAHKTWKK